ncbi:MULTISPECIES: LURP-one-related/scramblase family protein [Anaerococcus]|uniref:LURP-one-related/scramblase family protein n=1 Tax=Anaerococcus TaxID=165779 RepID=UPI002430B2D8|nr:MULTISPECIES: LURP-one-related family protein [Anaerococcus]MDD7767009.1 LURP-one-related family protein [Anaerococcus vaginalis]MDY6126859.1 LURP-one-related family protein [Anaerococcus sp.]
MKKYYFKEKFFKITDKYPILDENGKEVFFFDQDFKFVGYEAKLKDMNGNILFNISKKILSFLQTYYVDFCDGSRMEINQKLSFLKRKVDAFYDGKELNLKGSFMDHDFEVYYKNNLIADMNKKFFAFSDQYELTVYDENFTLVLIALCLCINEMKNRDDAAAASSSN